MDQRPEQTDLEAQLQARRIGVRRRESAQDDEGGPCTDGEVRKTAQLACREVEVVADRRHPMPHASSEDTDRRPRPRTPLLARNALRLALGAQLDLGGMVDGFGTQPCSLGVHACRLGQVDDGLDLVNLAQLGEHAGACSRRASAREDR
jgi:hypothetical protein